MSPILELRAVTKLFGDHAAVNAVSFAVQPGELFALVGPSGCGKTTTLRLVAGFEQPTSGGILLDGRPLGDLPPYRRNVSTVFQSYALFPHMTARENIEFGLRRKKAPAIAERVRALIDLVQLDGKQDRKPAQLSGGEKQRVALARSLALEPKVLLLDEPLSALDPNLRKQVRGELKSLQRRTGIAFVMVTHDQEEALSMADRIAVMHDGRLEQTGSPRELYLHPRTRFVAGFLGAVNWIDGIGVRPEAIRVAELAAPGTRCAVVRNSVFLGNCIHLELTLEAGEDVVAELPAANAKFSPGQQVHLSWDASGELRVENS